jgi:integrase/recombinase XerD
MALQKQAKILTKAQIKMVAGYLAQKRHSERNLAMFLLSVKAGLRAIEIANVQWRHVVDSSGNLMTELHLTNSASKGCGGRVVPLHKDLHQALEVLFDKAKQRKNFCLTDTIIQSQRGGSMDRQVIVNFFHRLYKDLGLVGCSSHSGRRTFATELGRRLSNAGCSIHDLSSMMGHSSISVTQRYLDTNKDGQKALVNMW